MTIRGLARKGFDLDLTDGVANENRIEDVLRYGTVEVKKDELAASTGNFCVEIAYRGKPSGIRATTAKTWAITYTLAGSPVDLLLPTDLVKKMAWYFYIKRDSRQGGDFGRTDNVLIPCDALHPVVASGKYHDFDVDELFPAAVYGEDVLNQIIQQREYSEF